MKKLAIIGSSGGNLYNQGGSDPKKMMEEIFTQADSAGIEVAYVQFVGTNGSMDNISMEAKARLWTLSGKNNIVCSDEATLKEINTMADEKDEEMAQLIRDGQIDGIVLLSCDPKGINHKALTAAAEKEVPCAGTGGTSMANTQSMGCKVIAASGTTGTTNRTRAISAMSAFSKEWKLLGSKGTTGTQASFLELFDGDQETIDKIDPMIAEKMGFKECYPVSGQTYSRKVDTRVANILAGIAASAHKMSNDIRLLQHLKEVEEPFEKSQIGSSAMAYKRNPMRSERIASLSRYVMVDALNPAITSATQWFERTLDDSANKRLSIPEGFLAIDGILDLCLNVVDGLVVYPKVIEKHMMAELPFMATENIMMDAVKAGGDRQELHERIRELSMEAGKTVKVEGKDNNLLELIAADPAFNLSLEDLQRSMDPKKYIGRAKEQTERFVNTVVQPILDSHKELLGVKAEINV